MEIGLSLVYIVIYFLVGLIGMSGFYAPVVKKFEQTLTYHYTQFPFPHILVLFIVSSVSAYFLVGVHDFIEPLTFLRMLAPIGLAALIFMSQFFFERIGQILLIIACVAVEVYLQPIGIGNPFPSIPVPVTQIALIALFSIFCIKADIFNTVPHTLTLPYILMLFGICVLAIVGATPLYVCLISATLIGALATYLSLNFQTIYINFDNVSCSALAFLVAHVLLLNLGEFSFPSCFVITTLFWSELLVALWNRWLITHEGTLEENTNYHHAAYRFDAKSLMHNMLRAGCVILFISWFQLFAKNPYSLFMVATFIAVWLNNSLGEVQPTVQDLKDINREFVNNIKDNIQETKKIINSRKGNKK